MHHPLKARKSQKVGGNGVANRVTREGNGNCCLGNEVDEVVEIKPESCGKCGQGLDGVDPAPLRHQVMEIPPIQPHVTEDHGCQHQRIRFG